MEQIAVNHSHSVGQGPARKLIWDKSPPSALFPHQLGHPADKTLTPQLARPRTSQDTAEPTLFNDANVLYTKTDQQSGLGMVILTSSLTE